MRRFLLTMLFMVAAMVCAYKSLATTSPDQQTTACVCVNGTVHLPGRYSWHKGMTIADAIKAANGFTGSATHKINILHSDYSQEIFVWNPTASTINKTPVLREGDTLFVSELKRIF